jgi:hypothetical protein
LTHGDDLAVISYQPKTDKESDCLKIYHVNELNRNKNGHYILDKLFYKLDLNKVKGFIYGAFSTRFWMMRIGINQLIMDNQDSKELNLPFYSWQCLSI